jgi:hypothetical protein
MRSPVSHGYSFTDKIAFSLVENYHFIARRLETLQQSPKMSGIGMDWLRSPRGLP